MSTRHVALVTGAARGIGLATAQGFAAQGWRVVLLDRDADELARVVSDLPDATALVCDISDPDAVAASFATLDRLDCLVNNAGVAQFGPIEACDFALWRTIMATNLDGTFLCSQAALPFLKDSRGSIVNVASISGLRASTLRVAYGTSKAAVIQLTKAASGRTGRIWYPRELRLPRTGAHQAGDGSPQPRDYQRLS